MTLLKDMEWYKKAINPLRVPKHVAIIMDGNGRWAKLRGFERTVGHSFGMKAVEEAVSAAEELGVKTLTLYAFSTENWKRPRPEVAFLMRIFREAFRQYKRRLKDESIRFMMIGRRDRLGKELKELVEELESETAKCNRLTLAVAIDYGGRDEILRAARFGQEGFLEGLDSSKLGDVDLLIRTSGEMRISNFLLWGIAYAEMVFLDVLWPDFRRIHFYHAVYEFQLRERRFGKVS